MPDRDGPGRRIAARPAAGQIAQALDRAPVTPVLKPLWRPGGRHLGQIPHRELWSNSLSRSRIPPRGLFKIIDTVARP